MSSSSVKFSVPDTKATIKLRYKKAVKQMHALESGGTIQPTEQEKLKVRGTLKRTWILCELWHMLLASDNLMAEELEQANNSMNKQAVCEGNCEHLQPTDEIWLL